jgi:hypothetical protein
MFSGQCPKTGEKNQFSIETLNTSIFRNSRITTPNLIISTPAELSHHIDPVFASNSSLALSLGYIHELL